MNYDKNFLTRTYLQLGLIFVVVLLLGMYRNGKAINAQNNEEKEEIAQRSLPKKLEPQVAFDDSFEIPDLVFGNDENWENAQEVDNETVIMIGEGNIDGKKVIVKCRYNLIDGGMNGRYLHENGTALDLNGQVSSSGDELEIHLGHKSNNTFSTWILYPDQNKTEKGEYAFSGYWGKSKKPSEITFIVK